MNRIENLFKNKPSDVLTIYFTAGYPNLNDTEDIILELDKAGVDLIEIGMPYSDPLADGPVIQASSTESLKNGMNLDLLFEQLKDIRSKIQVPLVLMGYYNQVLQYGLELFCKKASEVGVDGLILPDLPVDEFNELCVPIFKRYGLTCTFLVTPSSTDERIREIDAASSGFLYAVSSHSITGGNSANNLSEYGSRLAALDLKNPIQVGFGIHDATSFQEATAIANGGIIGSAFIKAISEEGELDNNICSFIQSIRSKE